MSIPPAAGPHAADLSPSDWAQRWLGRLPAGATVLDFAAGRGRHVRLALAGGARVTAADRDAAALASVDPAAERLVADLEAGPWPFGARRFDVVLCANFLHRARLDLLMGLVAPGGLLVYETFALGNERYGRPSNPAFLLRPGELYEAAARAGLHVLAYEHGFTGAARPSMVQRLAAARPPFEAERYPLVG
jgi:SAM-dependent methyltransferase